MLPLAGSQPSNYVLDGIIPYESLIQGVIPHDKSFPHASDFNSQVTCQITFCPIDISRVVMVRCVLGEHYDEPPGGFDGGCGRHSRGGSEAHCQRCKSLPLSGKPPRAIQK